MVAEFAQELTPAAHVQGAEEIGSNVIARCDAANRLLRALLDAVFPRLGS